MKRIKPGDRLRISNPAKGMEWEAGGAEEGVHGPRI
jgi:hypothetical protein